MLSEKDQLFRVRSQIKGDFNSSKKYSSPVCVLSFVCTCAIEQVPCCCLKYVVGKTQNVVKDKRNIYWSKETNVVSHLSFHPVI